MALYAFEDGRANQSISDPDILARASQLDRAIITLNRFDFKKLHAQVPEHAGIIICTEDPDRNGQARRIDEAIAEAGELRAKLIRVYRQK